MLLVFFVKKRPTVWYTRCWCIFVGCKASSGSWLETSCMVALLNPIYGLSPEAARHRWDQQTSSATITHCRPLKYADLLFAGLCALPIA
jgi:hypothetical protein